MAGDRQVRVFDSIHCGSQIVEQNRLLGRGRILCHVEPDDEQSCLSERNEDVLDVCQSAVEIALRQLTSKE